MSAHLRLVEVRQDSHERCRALIRFGTLCIGHADECVHCPIKLMASPIIHRSVSQLASSLGLQYCSLHVRLMWQRKHSKTTTEVSLLNRCQNEWPSIKLRTRQESRHSVKFDTATTESQLPMRISLSPSQPAKKAQKLSNSLKNRKTFADDFWTHSIQTL